MNATASSGQRADKWLWHARLVKTRTLAANLVEGGKLRVNRRKVRKAAALVRPGDVLTFFHGGRVHTIEVIECAERRGPAPQARLLYRDLSEPPCGPMRTINAS